MLTQDQKATFCKAIAFVNDSRDAEKAEEFSSYGICKSVSDVVETLETVNDIKSAAVNCRTDECKDTPFGKLYIFRKVDQQSEGYFYVMDFGKARASF